jgi:hypothetical protein
MTSVQCWMNICYRNRHETEKKGRAKQSRILNDIKMFNLNVLSFKRASRGQFRVALHGKWSYSVNHRCKTDRKLAVTILTTC